MGSPHVGWIFRPKTLKSICHDCNCAIADAEKVVAQVKRALSIRPEHYPIIPKHAKLRRALTYRVEHAGVPALRIWYVVHNSNDVELLSVDATDFML